LWPLSTKPVDNLVGKIALHGCWPAFKHFDQFVAKPSKKRKNSDLQYVKVVFIGPGSVKILSMSESTSCA